jgi:hypothetical protein
MQPGRDRHSTTSQPSSTLLIMTLNRIRHQWGPRCSPGRGAGTPESPEPSWWSPAVSRGWLQWSWVDRRLWIFGLIGLR